MTRLLRSLGTVIVVSGCARSAGAPSPTPAPTPAPAAVPAPAAGGAAAVGAGAAGQPVAPPAAGRGVAAGGGRGAGAGGRGGGGGRGGPAVDTSLYVRTAPPTDPIITAMWNEGMHHSQAENLAQVLFDSIGPRLVNSDRYNAGQDWLIKTYASWGVTARREQWGTWNSWQRGPTHLDLIAPRVRSLEAMMLAWSPGTDGKTVEGDVILMPDVKTAEEFNAWLPKAKGKFVLTSPPNPSCRAGQQWIDFGQPGAAAKNDSIRAAWGAGWRARTLQGGNPNVWPKTAGVAAVISTNWSNLPGIDKVFGTVKQEVPTIDVTCEDYNLLFRLAEKNQGPRVRLSAGAKFLGEKPVFNVVAEIKGSERPNEYIVFSAHYDSWDGGSGATDNGTGTITMLEALRILKKVYPHPKRTIIVGHWGGEEQGLNGSESYVEDHPDIVRGMRAGWNQDNGTGRIVRIGPGPITNVNDHLVSWLSELPSQTTGWVKLGGANPMGARGSSDNFPFQCAKASMFETSALGWDYSNTTWHTNRDTFDKVVLDDLENNATLIAMLTYEADKDGTLPAPIAIDSVVNAQTGLKTVAPYNCPKSTRSSLASTR